MNNLTTDTIVLAAYLIGFACGAFAWKMVYADACWNKIKSTFKTKRL